MNITMIFYMLGWILNVIAGLMLAPFLVSLYYGEPSGKYFIIVGFIMLIVGFMLTRNRPKNTKFYAKEGLVMTALSWILLSVTGCLPFYYSGEIPNFINALFETISGFTTTGASILHEVESMSHCMMFWRCLIQWIGGMGVLVFLLALIPLTGGQDLYIMKVSVCSLQKCLYLMPFVHHLLPQVQVASEQEMLPSVHFHQPSTISLVYSCFLQVLIIISFSSFGLNIFVKLLIWKKLNIIALFSLQPPV